MCGPNARSASRPKARKSGLDKDAHGVDAVVGHWLCSGGRRSRLTRQYVRSECDMRESIKNNLFRLLEFTLPNWRRNFHPLGRSHIRMARNQLQGNGLLTFGIQWPGGKKDTSQLVVRNKATISVLGNFRIYSGATIWVNEGATLEIGSGYINNNLNMSVFSKVTIGHRVAISENVLIRDSDNHSLNGSNPTAGITIGDDVWIGANVTILKGVSIGDGAVVAAGSLVNRDVPPRSLVAGVPAKVKKMEVFWK